MNSTITIHLPEVEQLNRNLEALLAMIQGQQPAQPDPPVEASAPAAPKPTEPEPAEAPDSPAVRAVLAQLRREKGAEACKDILRRHGVEALSKLPVAEYAAVLQEAQEAMA